VLSNVDADEANLEHLGLDAGSIAASVSTDVSPLVCPAWRIPVLTRKIATCISSSSKFNMYRQK